MCHFITVILNLFISCNVIALWVYFNFMLNDILNNYYWLGSFFFLVQLYVLGIAPLIIITRILLLCGLMS